MHAGIPSKSIQGRSIFLFIAKDFPSLSSLDSEYPTGHLFVKERPIFTYIWTHLRGFLALPVGSFL
jgi:hypothetical protein